MDMLKERAEVFNRLLFYKYNFVLGRKGVLTNICLSFDKVHFHHLIGLQRLTDMPQLRRDRTKIFDQILNGELTYAHITGSSLFDTVEKRFLSFVYIEEFLDSNELIFRYNRKVNPSSKMKAEYILKNEINDLVAYVCIDKSNGIDEYFCRSFFPKEDINYTVGHTSYTLLYKEKVNILTQAKVVQFDKLSSKDDDGSCTDNVIDNN